MFDFSKVQQVTTAKIVLIAALTAALSIGVAAQEIVDRTVATVSDGVKSEIITLSDVRWQLALQPNTPIDPPRADDMNAAVLRLVDQRIFALEAERLPRPAPDEKAINDEIAKTLRYFSSPSAFEERLKKVGFDSIKDENFQSLIARRVAIDNYLDFRFRSFIVITPEEEAKYYRETYVPDFRKRSPGIVVPTLEEARKEINGILTEERVSLRIESFLDDAKRRVEIEVFASF